MHDGITTDLHLRYASGDHMKKQVAVILLSASGLLLTFQNCGSKFQFNGNPGSSIGAKASDDLTNHVLVTSDPSLLGSQLDSVPPSGSGSGMDPGKGSDHLGSGGGKVDPNVDPNLNTEFVECDLGFPNSKITLLDKDDLATGSNKAESRVCMSKHACLDIINDFAKKRDCKLSGIPAAKGSADNCTDIFPGKGVCKNSESLSDKQIETLLGNMSK